MKPTCERFRSIEDYLKDRGWKPIENGYNWRSQDNTVYNFTSALAMQIERDVDVDEGGWKVVGITLERA